MLQIFRYTLPYECQGAENLKALGHPAMKKRELKHHVEELALTV